MKSITHLSLLLLFLACGTPANSPKVAFAYVDGQSYTAVNRQLSAFKDGDYKGVRLNERSETGMAWLVGQDFKTGTIEFDVQGRDGFQKSFVGVAFHGQDNHTYEAVYFRPFNFQAEEAIRRSHGVQYIAKPDYGWRVLRTLRTDEFENQVQPTNIQATDWFHVRLEVETDQLRVFVNDNPQPSLEVMRLRTDLVDGRIGFWVGSGSDGRFANLIVNG